MLLLSLVVHAGCSGKPCFYGISHNFNTGDMHWGYWGLEHPYWTHERLKHVRINRKPPPQRESSGLLTEFRKTNNLGALANRFAIDYHYRPCKYGDRHMTDYQMMAQAEFILDYFKSEDKPLLYVVWDEKVPLVPWGTPAPSAGRAILESPAKGGTLPAPRRVSVEAHNGKPVNVTQPAYLEWRNGGNAERFKVYFGSSPNVSLAEEVDDAVYDEFDLVLDPGQLIPDKRYYWRVDSVNRDGKETKGELWSFRSGP